MKSQRVLGDIINNSIKKSGYERIKDAADEFGLAYETLRKTVSESHIPRDPTLLEYAEHFNIDPALIIRVAQQSRFERKTGKPLESLGEVNESDVIKLKEEAQERLISAEKLIAALEGFFDIKIKGTGVEAKIIAHDAASPKKKDGSLRQSILHFFDAVNLSDEDQSVLTRMISNMKKE